MASAVWLARGFSFAPLLITVCQMFQLRDRIRDVVQYCLQNPKALVRFHPESCLFFRRVLATLLGIPIVPRRDKYQKKLKEYWVDVSTQGTFQKTSEEVFREQLSGEGMADDITVGGVNPGEPLDASSGESSAGEDESDDDADSGAGKPRKGGRGKGNGNAKTSIEEEKALEVNWAVYRFS